MASSGTECPPRPKQEPLGFTFECIISEHGKSFGANNTEPDPGASPQVPHIEPRLLIEMAPWKNVDAIIADRLFLGNIQPAKSTRYLQEHRVSHIVSVTHSAVPADWPQSGLTQHRIAIADVGSEDLLIQLPQACHFIQQALANGGVVLVHSDKGQSRSAAVVAAYLMYTQRVSATVALEMVRTAREQIWVQPGFQEQLVLFGLCNYNPHPAEGIYKKWRMKVDSVLAQQAQQ